MQVYIILALLVALLVTVFAVQNNAVIAVTLFAWRIEGSLAIILMGTLFLGILVGLFLLTPAAIRGRLTASDLRKRLHKSEQEIDQVLEVLPGIVERLREISPLWADAQRREEV